MRDLPELESVSTGNRASRTLGLIAWLLISAVAGGAFAAVVWAAAYAFRDQHLPLAALIVLGLGVAIALAVLLARSKAADWRWDLDPDGITIHGLFSTRHMPWSEITEAKPGAGGKYYHLKTAKRWFTIANLMQSSGETNGEVIGASLYQHLRRYGKADESLLTPGARTLWIRIPDEVPKETDWHHPNPPNWSILMAVTVVLLVIAVIGYFFGLKLKLGKILGSAHNWAGGLVAWAYKKLRDRLIVARSVSVRSDHIEIRTARQNLYLLWQDIAYVRWDNTHKSMTLGKGMFTSVAVIPYEDDPQAAACMLSIIRHLRLARHTPPVLIPIQLLPRLYEGASAPIATFADTDAAEVKVASTVASVLLSVLPVILAFLPIALAFWVIKDPKRMLEMGKWIQLLPIVALGGFALALIGVFVIRTTYRADASGITVKTPLKRRFIDWREITNYTVATASGARSKRRLADSTGRVILETPYLKDAEANDARFIAFLDARLAHVRQDQLPTLTR